MLEIVRDLLEKKLDGAEFVFSPPEIAGRGHASTNAAFILADKERQSPMKSAEELQKYLEDGAPKDFFAKIEIAEPGFLNIWFSESAIQQEFKKIIKAGDKWGELKEKGKVIVEYSQPNIAKPMHVGHLRSTIIGDALANVFEFAGYKVTRWNYLGDWGTQFGKLIVMAKKKTSGEEVNLIVQDVRSSVLSYRQFAEEAKENPKLEEEARKEFRKLEKGDEVNRKLWEESRKASIEELKKIYGLLGVEFDEWTGEAFYEKDLEPLTKRLIKDGIATESEGALVVDLKDEGLPPGLIRKSDGATLYLTRDIASLEHRIKKYKPDTILYVVDNAQSLYFQQLFAIADKIGLETDAHHVKFGLMLSEDMKRLSTRAGVNLFLEDVISESVKRARVIVDEKQSELDESEREKIAKTVGVGALKYNDLSQNRMSDIAFDWDKMLSLEGNSGPYLQYSYARLRSILNKAGKFGGLKDDVLEGEADLDLVFRLVMFPEIIRAVTENYFPHYLANYLYDLARAVNSYYEKEPVLKAEGDLRDARLHLVSAAAGTLKTGLKLLGIETVERM